MKILEFVVLVIIPGFGLAGLAAFLYYKLGPDPKSKKKEN